MVVASGSAMLHSREVQPQTPPDFAMSLVVAPTSTSGELASMCMVVTCKWSQQAQFRLEHTGKNKLLSNVVFARGAKDGPKMKSVSEIYFAWRFFASPSRWLDGLCPRLACSESSQMLIFGLPGPFLCDFRSQQLQLRRRSEHS